MTEQGNELAEALEQDEAIERLRIDSLPAMLERGRKS